MPEINVEKLSQVAEIVIGIVAIYSLYLSRKALTKSDWNSALTTVPSLVIRPWDIHVGVKDNPSDGGYGITQTGHKIEARENDKRSLIFNITFECFNEGRGAAFNLKKPKITGGVEYKEWYRKTPLHQTLEDEAFQFSVQVQRPFEEWKEKVEERTPVLVKIDYTNDQGNVNCVSTWKAEIQPFELKDGALIVKDERLLNRNSSVIYTPAK